MKDMITLKRIWEIEGFAYKRYRTTLDISELLTMNAPIIEQVNEQIKRAAEHLGYLRALSEQIAEKK